MTTIIYLLIGGAIIYWFMFLGGQGQVNNLLGSVFKGGSGLNLGGGTNIQTRTNTGSNVSGNGAGGSVQSMLQKMGVDMNVNNGSGQNIYRHRQVNHQDTANQNNVNIQRSNVI
jgi:outer membrane lipoprotein SlyB